MGYEVGSNMLQIMNVTVMINICMPTAHFTLELNLTRVTMSQTELDVPLPAL
jgi:hypothetical protein